MTADLGLGEQLGTVERRLAGEDSPVDLLINNAGFARGGPFVNNDIDSAANVVSVNVTALMRLSHAAAVAMVATGRGGIVNISSVAGSLIAPDTAVYSATKAFVTSFSESLHQELAPLGVTVTAVLPGFTRTEFQVRADVASDHIPAWAWQSASEVASEALSALAARRPRVVTGRFNKIVAGAAGAAQRQGVALGSRASREGAQ